LGGKKEKKKWTKKHFTETPKNFKIALLSKKVIFVLSVKTQNSYLIFLFRKSKFGKFLA
jgi:hypothetical protein